VTTIDRAQGWQSPPEKARLSHRATPSTLLPLKQNLVGKGSCIMNVGEITFYLYRCRITSAQSLYFSVLSV